MEQVDRWFDILWSLILDGLDSVLGAAITLADATTADHLEGAAIMALLLLGPSLVASLLGGFREGLRIEWQHYRGQPKVIDGDTLEIRGERIRLFGIDAPELGQPWWDEDGREGDAGEASRDALASMVHGRRLAVKVLREDRYRRSIAIVKVDGKDVARTMIDRGKAFAAPGSTRYQRAEAAAKRRRRGFWQGELIMPWDYRMA